MLGVVAVAELIRVVLAEAAEFIAIAAKLEGVSVMSWLPTPGEMLELVAPPPKKTAEETVGADQSCAASVL